MITSKEESTTTQNLNTSAKLLVQEFYQLRKTFEADYSGKLRSHKYEETRDFTIALNHAIFQANQMISETSISTVDTRNLEERLKNLRNDFNFLKS